MRKSERWSGLPEIEKIHLPEKNMTLRVVLLAAAILLAAACLVSGLTGLLNQDPGWREIEPQIKEMNYSQEFTLRYDLGGKGADATVENKMLTELYSRLMEEAYLLFDPQAPADTERNLRYLSDHPNQTVQLEHVLYEALQKLLEAGSRYQYLAPVYVEQSRIFRAETPEEAQQYDPAGDPELRAYLQACADFARDPAHIDLELLPMNQVVLHVSPEYLRFVSDNEIEYLLDFGWLRNAFIVDWVASEMEAKGLVTGSITSSDGYSRNLDPREMDYAYNLFDREGLNINIPGALTYRGPMSFVFLRNYPLSEVDMGSYLVFPDGSSATHFVDPADGLSRSAEENLLVYSGELGCADLALLLGPIYIAEELDRQALEQLPVFAIWGEDQTMVYTQKDAVFTEGQNRDLYTFRYLGE